MRVKNRLTNNLDRMIMFKKSALSKSVKKESSHLRVSPRRR
jgi:hypothetical protein